MKGKISIKTIIVMIIIVLVMVLGVIGVKTVQTFMSGAAAGNEPKNVTAVSSEDGKSATVTWTSDKETMGVVQYGPNMATLLLTAEEASQTTTHSVNLTNLGPGKTYYYRIVIGNDTPYDNNGVPFSFKTKGSAITPTPTAIPEQKTASSSGTVLSPTISLPNTNTCNRSTDYNKDGTTNSLDYTYCLKNGGSSSSSTPSASKISPTAAPGACQNNVDYNKDGTINSLDKIKCLQSKS